MNQQDDIFQLIFKLSQMDERAKIIELFCEKSGEIFKHDKFFYSPDKSVKAPYIQQIKTGDISHGYLVSTEIPSKENSTTLINAIQMLAVILEQIRIKDELKNKNKSLEAIAQKRLEAIKANVKELESNRIQSERLINELQNKIVERQKIENELRESEEKFRLSFQTTPDAVSINRLEDGLYVDINQGFKEISGYTAEEIIGKTSYEIGIWVDIKTRERLVKAVKKSGKLYNMQAKFRTKDGRIVDGLMSASLINLNNAPHIINITRDISEIKKAQDELQKSEIRFRKAFENSTSGMCIASPKGEFLQVNRKMCEILGYSVKELLGITFSKITHPEDIAISIQNVREVIEGKKDTFGFKKRFLRKDGETIWAVVSSSLIRDTKDAPLYFITHITDITEKKKSDEIIKKERDQAQRYLDIAGVMFASLNKNGEITLINKKGCEILGYDKAEDLMGKNWMDTCLPHENREEVKHVFHEQMTGNIKAYEYYENPVITKSGEKRIIAFNNTVLLDLEDNITGVLFSGEDITMRVRAESEIKKLNAELENRVAERTAELEKVNKELGEVNDVFVGREMRIIELKEEVERLKNKLNEVQ